MIRMLLNASFLALAAMAAGGSVWAHHSFSATYDESKTQKIEGKLVQFLYRNPHSFVHVEAPDAEGKVQRWSVEWGGAGQLGGQGISRDTLKPGDHVIIVGTPGRNAAEYRLRMNTIVRPLDNWRWGGAVD